MISLVVASFVSLVPDRGSYKLASISSGSCVRRWICILFSVVLLDPPIGSMVEIPKESLLSPYCPHKGRFVPKSFWANIIIYKTQQSNLNVQELLGLNSKGKNPNF